MTGKKSSKLFAGLLLAGLLVTGGAEAFAEEWTDGFAVRVRAIGILPDESSSLAGLEIDDAVVPELDISYFFNDNFAMELILATAQHEASLKGAGEIGDFWILPPTLLAQYHLPLGDRFKPYVGAGINYTIVYGEDAKGPVTSLNIDNGVGWALQAGVDYHLDENWFLNLDVKKLWLNVDATAAPVGAVDIDVDPWIVGVGFGYRF